MKKTFMVLVMLLVGIISVMGQTAEELYVKGMEAYNNRDYATALTYFLQAADNNNASAQRMVGSCYQDGRGVKKNVAQAVAWYKKAMNNGDQYAASLYDSWICWQPDYVPGQAEKPIIIPNSESNTTSTAPTYSQAEYEQKCNELKQKYDATRSSVEAKVKQYEKDINRVYAELEAGVYTGRVVIDDNDVSNWVKKAASIAINTIDQKLIIRLVYSFRRYYSLKRGYKSIDLFYMFFWNEVYKRFVMNNELYSGIFYIKNMYDVFQNYEPEDRYRNRILFEFIDRVSDEITRASDSERQAYLYSEYVSLCRLGKDVGKLKIDMNTSLSTPICKSFVDEIINTRSSQTIAKCDNITKEWSNYQSDIYNPTEEVRLYCRLRDLDVKSSRDLCAIINTYIQKYSNSGNDISNLVLKNFESLNDEESANAIITMIHDHGDFIKQNANFDTRLNDLLFSRLSSLDAKRSIKIIDNLINNNASYMQSHFTFGTKIKTLYLTKLAELDEGTRNEHILETIAQNKKYANEMKQKFRTVETAYTWIKTNSYASYRWTDMIDKYLSCFPTSVHKTELSNLRSSLMERIREGEAEDRRREEAEKAAEASRLAAEKANKTIKEGDRLQVEMSFDCGFLCTTSPVLISGEVIALHDKGVVIEVRNVAAISRYKYTDTDWETINKEAKIGKTLFIENYTLKLYGHSY